MLKLKLKGLDMLISVFQSNKNLVKNDDFLCVETLMNLILLSKNEKSLSDPIIKK